MGTPIKLFLLSTALTTPVAAIFYFPCSDDGINNVEGTFSSNFMWGVAGSAYQIEGGWNADGKGVSIWDTYTHSNPGIPNNATGDVACDSYHKWQQDVALLKAMNVGYYRFSLSWPRLLPTGLQSGGVNQAGVKYYMDLINALNASGIQPVVTLFHWDLPQALQMKGGWANPKSISWFKDYAHFCFLHFGAKVKYWVTINEPYDIAVYGYTPNGGFAPADYTSPSTLPYKVGYHLLKAHAEVYRLYHTDPALGSGQVGISLALENHVAATMKEEDKLAQARMNEFMMGWFAHPIFVNGDYPPLMKQVVGYRSNAAGLNSTRLTPLTAADRALINGKDRDSLPGSADFLGLVQYSSALTYNSPTDPTKTATFFDDLQVRAEPCKQWVGDSQWDKMTPWSIRKVLLYIRFQYGNPPVFILANGFTDKNGSIADSWRSEFFRQSISHVLYAKSETCNVIGYLAWTLMDNFAWAEGYTSKFGLHYVNFSDPALPRTPKQSAKTYASIIAANGFPKKIITTTTPKSSTSPCTSKLLVLMLIMLTFVQHIW